MRERIGLPQTVLADAGFASAATVAELEAHKIEPLAATPSLSPIGPTTSGRHPSQSPNAASANPGALR
jgi:hypothetical protein